MEAVEDAGLRQIDHLITTHWHGDHYGGLSELATRIPIRHYIDHGPTVEDNERVQAFIASEYRDLYGAATRTVVEPGDTVPLRGVEVKVMASAGEVTRQALPGAGAPNPYCSAFEPQAEDLGDNAQSVGVHLRFGDFRALQLGDLTVNKEFELMCPANPIGSVDLYIVSHHGLSTSNSPVLVHGVAPRAAGSCWSRVRRSRRPDADLALGVGKRSRGTVTAQLRWWRAGSRRRRVGPRLRPREPSAHSSDASWAYRPSRLWTLRGCERT